MTVKIKTLEITNYRNIRHLQLNFDGNAKIVGDNRIGKTNTLEALYWLITDKLLNGSKEIEQIKPLDDTKKVVSVRALFDVDGKSISLGKEYKEEWVKTRGSNELVMKGHTTNYFYNGVPQSTKKVYDNLVATDFGLNVKQYVGIDLTQLLINPLYLGKMGDTDDWKNLRAMIVDIVGDVSDSDVFEKNPHLKPIAYDIENNLGRTDQVVKQYKSAISGIEDELVRFEGQIQMLDETPRPSDEALELARKGVEECDANIRSMRSDSVDDKATMLIDEEILKIKNQIVELKRADFEKNSKNPVSVRREELERAKTEKHSQIQSLAMDRVHCLSKISDLELGIKKNDAIITDANAKRLNLIDELKVLDNKIANPEMETECPHCHRPYDADKLEETKALILKSLNEKRLALINEGKDNTLKRNSVMEENETLKKRLEELNEECARLESSIQMAHKDIESLDAELIDLNATGYITSANPKIAELEEQIKAKEQEKADIRLSVEKREESIRSLIAAEFEKKERFQKTIADYDYFMRSGERKSEIEQARKDVQTKLIQAEQKVELVKEFIKAKLEMLDSNIKKVFDDISFMLIEPNINGGYNTVCKPYIRGTNTLWKSGSKSEQLTTGVAICEKIKATLGLPNFPFLFDEGGEVSAETFATRFDTNSQLICVQVKDNIHEPLVINF